LNKLHALIHEVFSTTRLGRDVTRLFQCYNFHLHFVAAAGFLRSLSIAKIADLNGRHMKPGVEWRKVVHEKIAAPRQSGI
jgi:hypothetical protein